MQGLNLICVLYGHQTEVQAFHSLLQDFRHMMSNQILTLDGITLACSNTVRNFDQDISFNVNIKQTCWSVFLHLHIIFKFRNILSQSDAEKLR